MWRPGWILSHLFVLACVVAFVNLGFWQLRRLDERKEYNAAVTANQSKPVAPITEVLPAGPDSEAAAIEAAQYRVVTVTGTYDTADEVLVRNRTLQGLPGFWMLTPLVQADGTAVAVNRGWVPFATTDADGPWPEYAPPEGTVTVTGMIKETVVQSTGLITGATDQAGVRLSTLARVDLERFQQQVDERIYPVSVDLRIQEPAQGALPQPVPEPVLDDGPHLSYALQWFIFATLTCIVYPLLLRRTARNKAAEDDDEIDLVGTPAV
jgi:surfeit locus 1 family protein